MTKRGRTLEAAFQRHIRLAKIATGMGYLGGLAVLLTALAAEDNRTRIGIAVIAAAFVASGKYWAYRFYRCSKCAARIMPKGGAFFGRPPVHCPQCEQKLRNAD